MCFYLFQATQFPTAPHFTRELTETGCRLRRHLWNGHGALLVGLRSESQQHSHVDRVMYCFPVILSLGFPAQPTPGPAVITALNPKQEASQTLHLNSAKTKDSTPNSAQCRLQTAALPPGRAQPPWPLHSHLLVHRKRPGQAAQVHICVCTLHCLLLTGNTAQREGTRGRLWGIQHFS